MSNNWAAFFVALSLGLLYGHTLNATAPVVSEDPWKKESPGLIGLISVSLSIGAMVGSFFGGFISDRIGPKKTLGGGILICIICVVWIWTQTQNLALLIILRIFNGLGIGVATSVGPRYIGEQAAAKQRGMFTTMFQLFICTGQLIALAVSLGLHGKKDSWRYYFLTSGVWGLLFLIGLIFLPESAGYVASQNRKMEGRLSGDQGINADYVEETPSPSLWDDVKGVFKAAVTSKRAFVTGIMLATFQQITGINIFMLYSNGIFETIGWSGKWSNVASVVMLAWNLLAVITAIFLVDFLGRKPLLTVGFTCMLIGTVLMTVMGFMAKKQELSIGTMIGFTVPSVAIYLLGFQMGPGPMYFVTVAELYDAEIRGRAMGAINAINWIAAFIMPELFPTLFEKMGMVVFIIFAILCVIIIVFVIIFVTEMKGKTLEGQEGETQRLKSGNEDGGYSD